MGIPTYPRVPSPTMTKTLLQLPSEILMEIFSYFIVSSRSDSPGPFDYPLKTKSIVPKEELKTYINLRSTCRRLRTVVDTENAFRRYFPTDAVLRLYKPITYYRFHDLCESLYAPRAAIQTITIESIPDKPDPTVTENAMVRSMNARIVRWMDTFENLREVTAYCKPPGVEESSEYEFCANPLPTHGTGFLHAEAILDNMAKPASTLSYLTVLRLRGLEPEPHSVFDRPEWAVMLGKLSVFEIELEYKPPREIHDMDQELYEDQKYPEDASGPSNPELRLQAFAEQFSRWSSYLRNVRDLKINVKETQTPYCNRPTFRFNGFFLAAADDKSVMPLLTSVHLRRVSIDKPLMRFFLSHPDITSITLESSAPKHSRYGDTGGLKWYEIYQGFMKMPELRAFVNKGSSKDEKRVVATDGDGFYDRLRKQVDKKSLQDDRGDDEHADGASWLFLG